MIGVQKVSVSNRYAKFDFELHRNITIVRGDSGTGKTTLYSMIADYTRLGEASGVNISSAKKCVALVDIDWENQLRSVSDSIVFVDEGADFLASKAFAEAVKKSDNYYVIFNREGLHCLPYSVEEIYEIKTSGKFHKFAPMFKTDEKHLCYRGRKPSLKKYAAMLTEDSESGYQFFQRYCEDNSLNCNFAGSNSNIFAWLKEHRSEAVFVIADGAAFGSEIDRVMKLDGVRNGNVRLCLPESFEWLILRSGVIHTENSGDVTEMLDDPSAYIESDKYFSWENFFEDYLVQITLNTPFQYAKRRINPVYISKSNMSKIVAEIL